MAALWNRAGHYIFAMWFLLLSFYLSSFLLAYSQPSQIGCLPYFHTWCGLSANLGCRSEACCTQIAENTGRKRSSKIRYPRTIVQLCRYIFATEARIDNRQKLLSSNISPTCPHNMVKFTPPAADIGSVVWGTPANFNGFRFLGSLLHDTLVVGVRQTLRR